MHSENSHTLLTLIGTGSGVVSGGTGGTCPPRALFVSPPRLTDEPPSLCFFHSGALEIIEMSPQALLTSFSQGNDVLVGKFSICTPPPPGREVTRTGKFGH